MENLIKLDSGDYFVDPENDEFFNEDELRSMYGYDDVYRQHLTAVNVPKPEHKPQQFDHMSSTERQDIREKYPWLFYDGVSQEEVYWRKWLHLTKNQWDPFSWEMIDEAGRLVGIGPMGQATRKKIRIDFRDQRIRARYARRFNKYIEDGEPPVAGDVLYERVHAYDRN